MKRRLAFLHTLVLIIVGLRIQAVANDYTLDWWTVDGGGTMWSTGGNFELSGTIGQPDAGVMTGGDFELTGGFWFVAPAGPQLCPGDTNCDGQVTYADIDWFVEALSGESAWTHWPCPWLNADCNNDSDVTYADIEFFVALIGTTCP